MRNDIYAFGSKTAVFGKKNMICCAVYASDICLFDGSNTPSVPWQTSTCKHAAAQAWIQSCFYKIQLLQECNICQFQRAALLHILSSDATDPRREVFNTYAVLHTNIHATNWLTMFLENYQKPVLQEIAFPWLHTKDPHLKINITSDINFTLQEITFLPLKDQHTEKKIE